MTWLLAVIFFIMAIQINQFSIHVSAEEEVPSVEINVRFKGDGYAEISGEKYLPETAEIYKEGKYTISYPDATAGEIFHYEIRQTKMNDPKVIYDTRVYDLDVYILNDGENRSLCAVAVIHEGDEDTKPSECVFENRYITGNVYVLYRERGTGKILKEKANVCPVCIIDSEYSTDLLSFDGYHFVGLGAESAPVTGKVKKEDILVIYEYEKVKETVPDTIYHFVVTGIDKISRDFKEDPVNTTAFAFALLMFGVGIGITYMKIKNRLSDRK